MRRNALIHFGYDALLEDGTPVPNGVPSSRWKRLTPLDRENALFGIDFRASCLPRYVARSGYRVSYGLVGDLAESGTIWFYLLRPYAVPELTKAFAGLSDGVRREMEVGRCHVLIDYSHEGFSQWMFNRIYEALRVVDLPARQITLLSGDWGVSISHQTYVVEQDICDPVRVHSLNWFRNQVAESAMLLAARGDLPTWEEVEAATERPRLFLNFNRRNRIHRILVVTRLLRRGLLEEGLVSLDHCFEGRTNEEAYKDEAVRFGLSDSLLCELREEYPRIRPRLPLHVDTMEMVTNHAHTYTAWPYMDTWLSLVSETQFFESGTDQVFLSEKVFKPMLYFHPFLLVGNAGSLTVLHRMGFRTFHPSIDESYDRELDPQARLDKVFKELQRLACLTGPQRRDWFLGLSSVLRHNHREVQADRFGPAFDLWQDYLPPSP